MLYIIGWFCFPDDSPGISLATALIKAIRSKKPVEELIEIINSAPSHVSDDVATDDSSKLWVKLI